MLICLPVFFFFKQKTAYEMRISDWSSDVCSSDLTSSNWRRRGSGRTTAPPDRPAESAADPIRHLRRDLIGRLIERDADRIGVDRRHRHARLETLLLDRIAAVADQRAVINDDGFVRRGVYPEIA